MKQLLNKPISRVVTTGAVSIVIGLGSMSPASAADVSNPNGMIDIKIAPAQKFTGRIFFINDWDGGDKDNQNCAEELNRNPEIKSDVTSLSYYPGQTPNKVTVNGLKIWPSVLANASKDGKIAIAMGAHSKHVLAWLTKLPADSYNYNNIYLVSHSNWNEADGGSTYNSVKKDSDPELVDTHGEKLPRRLYQNLARISDLGVTIWEIPRTDNGKAGWGGKVDKDNGKTAGIKTLDLSDLGQIQYLKTGVLNPGRWWRNQHCSNELKKAKTLDDVKSDLITRYWDDNSGVPGIKSDYLPGGKYYNK